VRDFIPYGRQEIDEDDIAAVVEVLRGDWLTTGPAVERFERKFAQLVGAEHAVAVTNGTAALHLAMMAAGVGPGDEVIVPTMTFAASANAARYVGAEVRFCDVRPDTLGIDFEHAARLVTPRTRAIVVVDYAGIPCDLEEVMALADEHGLIVIEDACHAVGATYRGRPIGSIAHLSTFSFHPVKHLTTGEGGMVTTADPISIADCVASATTASIRTSASARQPGRGSTTSPSSASTTASQTSTLPSAPRRSRRSPAGSSGAAPSPRATASSSRTPP
jgi:perosamine synthetase